MIIIADMDRNLGNEEGWAGLVTVPQEVGTATHAYAAFEPSIKSKSHIDDILDLLLTGCARLKWSVFTEMSHRRPLHRHRQGMGNKPDRGRPIMEA